MSSENSSFILLAVDTSKIQPYIFGSNRLKENIGASYLVKQATEDWALEELKKAAPRNNLKVSNQIDQGKEIITDNLDAELIYAGGGNFVALFRTEKAAKDFTKALSTKVLLNAPGLRLDIYQEEHKWTGVGLAGAIKTLLDNMKKKRGEKPISTPLLGLGVTVMCNSTTMPAVAIRPDPDNNPQYVSAEIAAKVDAVDSANKWLRRELPSENDFSYPFDLDDLGRSRGETSYIAVVHADGNGMGKIISDFGKTSDNRKYIGELRKFSEDVKKISTAAMNAILELLRAKIKANKITGTSSVAAVELKQNSRLNYLPIRPLVFGGDDTTFVCDGRLGLSLATEYLRAFEKAAAEVYKKGPKLSACAGIAIVKSHYPFARAYTLAEELCGEAKKFRRASFENGGGALDWYFSMGGLYDDLENMRKREYSSKDGSLTLRPVSLVEEKPGIKARSWGEVKRVADEFQNGWGEKRNKAKALRDALRGGSVEVERFQRIYLEADENLPTYPPFTTNGWDNQRCGYFDPLELMDIFIDLTKK